MSAPKDIQEAKEDKLNRLFQTEVYNALLIKELDTKPQVGRPTIVDTAVLRKLYEAFMIGATDEEACFWANIGITAFYQFQKDYPEFAKLKEEWKTNPIMKARNTVFKNLDEGDMAFKFLERKRRDEFATKTVIVDERQTEEELKKIETDYDKVANKLRGQTVANDTPLQDKE